MSDLTTPGIIPRNKTTTIYGIQEVKSSIEAGHISIIYIHLIFYNFKFCFICKLQ